MAGGSSPRIISRAETKAHGLKRYFTGKPCKWGHVAERYVAGGDCVKCSKKRSAEWRQRNPGESRERGAKWRQKNREECSIAGVAFFMKQMTKKAPIPADLLVRQFPSHRSAL